MKNIIYALHGFLGLPSDFSLIKPPAVDWEINAVDYIHLRELSPENSLQEWGAHFCRYVVAKEAAEQNRRWLLGYSQGGRLALHAFFEKPELWEGLILISAHPGIHAQDKLSEETERLHRGQFNHQWARKFEKQDFQKTVEQWNSQSVFGGTQNEPQRLEQNYNRHQLAKCLDNWSLSLQRDFHSQLKHTHKKIIYIAGDLDTKYRQIALDLAGLNQNIRSEIAPDSGHRVLFDQPAFVSQMLMKHVSGLGNG